MVMEGLQAIRMAVFIMADKNNNKYVNAVRVTGFTLLGVLCDNFPVKFGNMFSVEGDDKNKYDIKNIFLENFEELIRKGIVAFPVRIKVIGIESALIVDKRIDKHWLQ